MHKKYSKHNDAFKLKVAIEALKGLKTTAEICQEFGIAASQVYAWKKQLEESKDTFSKKTGSANRDVETDRLLRTIGQLKVENDFLAKVLGQ